MALSIATRRGACALAIAAAFSPACESGSTATTGTGAGTTAPSSSSSATGTGGADGGGAATGGAGGTSPDELCVQTGHAGECLMCCASDQAEGFNTYVGALIQFCACTMGATCYAQCSDAGDLCSDPSAQMGSTACIGCVNAVAKTDPCFTATSNSVDAACDKDPSCAALNLCDQGCASLPM